MTAGPTVRAPEALLDTPLQRGPGAPPMQRQLHDRLKDAILAGRLAPGSRLPGSRALAELLAISRNTATAAYDLLAAEGYVQPDRRGTRVAALVHVPRAAPKADWVRNGAGGAAGNAAGQVEGKRAVPEASGISGISGMCDRPDASDAGGAAAAPALAARLARIQPSMASAAAAERLRPGVPALSHFPLAAWRRTLERAVRQAGTAALGYGDPLGEPALRAAIARHLAVARGVRCAPAQVVITEGAQEALSLCVRVLTNPGERAWVEDPGYRGAKAAMHAGDLRIVPMRVDAEGLCASEHDWRAAPPRLIYTTPSHQYPTGAVLTVARRLTLIALAQRHGAWIIEDDYDSEFRHTGEPIGAMQGLVEQAPVLYVGTFSKTMFPSLRMGFVVLPPALLTPLQAPLREMLRGGHRYEQLALAEFIESGQFSRHLGRMRRLYRERQQALRAALRLHLSVPHTLAGGYCGLHLTVRLPAQYPDRRIAEAARCYGIAPQPLSGFALQPLPQDNGLVLGYGNTPAELFEPLVRRLSQLSCAALT
jgi:GntR family transcriptional regulator/MocR family aminotransferase